MRPRQVALAVIAVVFLSSAMLVVAFEVWPREDNTFSGYVTREVATNALELLTLTLVGVIINEMVRRARDRNDFARRVRAAYSKAKAQRRRLRRELTDEERRNALRDLEDAQLEFEDLRDDAEREFGKGSEVFTNLDWIEKYLNNVLDARLPPNFQPVAKPGAFEDFVAKHDPGSRFAKELKGPYHVIREQLK